MTTEEKIKVMQAWIEGYPIQICTNGYWEDYNYEPIWNWQNSTFRIKPEPKYRPYNSAKEFLQSSKEHGPYIHIGNSHHWIATHVTNIQIELNCKILSYKELMPYTWPDGTPCGILE